jgi:hypothetical protein
MASPKQPLHHLLGDLIDASVKTQRQIANEIGYRKSNVISMLKQGHMPVPLSKVPALANALGVDPLCLLQRVLAEQEPELLEAMLPMFGLLLTENERDLIRRLRDRLSGEDVKYTGEMVDAVLDLTK